MSLKEVLEGYVRLPIDCGRLRVAADVVREHTLYQGKEFVSDWPKNCVVDRLNRGAMTMQADALPQLCIRCGHSGTGPLPCQNPSLLDLSSLNGGFGSPLTCQHSKPAGNMDAGPCTGSLERGRGIRRRPFGQRTGSLKQIGSRARLDRRDYSAQHFDSTLRHCHLGSDHTGAGLALPIFACVLTVAFATRVDALAHLGCGKGRRFRHRCVFHVMLTGKPHMWVLDGGKSITCRAKIDAARRHCRTVAPNAGARASGITAHRSIMWPGLPAKRGDRVSEGLRA